MDILKTCTTCKHYGILVPKPQPLQQHKRKLQTGCRLWSGDCINGKNKPQWEAR